LDSTVLIPAGGDQTRWASTLPKQLVTVNGESLLARLKRQTESQAEAFIILTADSYIESLFPGDTYFPRDSRCLCETLVNTRHLWGRRTVIILGDTVISNATMEKILTDRRPCAFWGNWTDILAVSVYEEEANALMMAMWSAVRDQGEGKLWQAYRAYCGFDLDDHQFDKHGTFIDTMDWSRDFDYVEEYREWIEREAKKVDLWA
jgi:hypothetical protein